jgi:uncharacterized damage-inducible protein DinB
LRTDEARRLFDYLIDARERFLATFREIGWEEFSKDREASWHSMLGIFLHILEVEASWLHYALQGSPLADSRDLNPAEYSNFDQLTVLNSEISSKTIAILEGLKGQDLSMVVAFKERSGTTRRKKEKVLMHAFVDEIAHVGEFVCLLWQLDVKPPFIDWLDYQLDG